MNDDEFLRVSVDYKELLKELKAFDGGMEKTAIELMRAVNNKAKAKIRKEALSRGYHKEKYIDGKNGSYNSGFGKNLKSYADRGYKAKIMMAKNAFYYRFIEYGATIPKRRIHVKGHTVTLSGFSYPARPLIYPIANSIWGTEEASKIMDKRMQKIIDKRFKENQK